MTPTDAQISAALDALAPTSHSRADVKAALTAAAEVGDYDLKCTNGHDRCYMGTSDDCPYCERVPAESMLDEATIERCAQVIKQWIDDVGASQHGRDLNTLLVAIRALKDKP